MKLTTRIAFRNTHCIVLPNEPNCESDEEEIGHKEIYLKSEADKVIAEKDKVITYARALVREDIKLILHQKYKRCLAMAERCKDKIENVVQYNEHDDWLIINEYWERWHERWIKIAEKIKEAK